MKNTMNHTGKAAVFVRGFMTKFADLSEQGKEAPLRVCQDAGLASVQELSENISVAYISKLARELVEDGVVTKKKRGRKFYMYATDKTDAFLDWLNENENWGTDLYEQETSEIEEKMEIADYMKKHKGILIFAGTPMPKAQYSFLMKKFQEGQLGMAFFDQSHDLIITEDYGEVSIEGDHEVLLDHVDGLGYDD